MRRSFIRVVTLVSFLLIIALYIGLPTVMAVAVVVPDRSPAGDAPDGFSEITVETEDGIRLAGWYAQPESGIVIVLVHGAGSGRNSVRSHATMLHDNGFGVLALDMRGYGDSEGTINRLGWTGTKDIGAAIEFLSERDDVKAIGGLGLSMGGEILLGAASTYPELKAVAVEGATHRCVDEYMALPKNYPLYRNFTQRVFMLMTGLFSRDEQPNPPLLESIKLAETTAFLFIAAGNDDEEIDYNTLFHETTRDRSSLWIIPNTDHTAGFDSVPDMYETRMVAFFSEELLEGTR